MENTSSATVTSSVYAGFGSRLGAFLIDGIIIGVVYSFIAVPVIAAIGFGVASDVKSMEGMSDDEAASAAMGMAGTIMAGVMTMVLAIYVIQLLYYSILESSKLQGSVGKLALGIKVVDLEGNRISFGKALLRSVGKILSGMVMYIGYLMAAFTEKKQGLHDMIASTLVVKK
jgi:uncharacterized RDD family membrane protein YckC